MVTYEPDLVVHHLEDSNLISRPLQLSSSHPVSFHTKISSGAASFCACVLAP
jgi:hypothetical protein